MKLNKAMKCQLYDLIHFTVLPAIEEDLGVEDRARHNEAIDAMIEELLANKL